MRLPEVVIDTQSGFCFGVIYAIEMAEEILNQRGYLYCLGEIVHNDEEVNRLRQKGLITINHDELKLLKNETVLIRAHGEPPETYRIADENNICLIDATCPVVLKLQNRIRKSFDNNEYILLFGKDGHAEVKGLMGQIEHKGQVFSNLEDLNEHHLPERVTVYSQTTKSREMFKKITNGLIKKGLNVQAHDTICTQVSDRDRSLRQFASKFDKVIFVAGTHSSNGKVLFQVCREVNENTRFVTGIPDLETSWINPGDRVGICGATSTPMWLMQNIKDHIQQYFSVTNHIA